MKDESRARFQFVPTAQKFAAIANGLLLLAVVVWTLCSNAARNAITELESLTSSQALDTTQAGVGRVVTVLAVSAVIATFITMLLGLGFGRRSSRSIKAWFVFVFLVCGWLAVWLGRHDLYWFGHTLRVSSEVVAATQLAEALANNWPSGDGDYPELGVVLGYPKENPVTLILAGEPIPVGRLKVVAVEKSKDGKTIRFQLSNPNHDTWLVRSREATALSEFVNGFDSHYKAKRTRMLSRDWWLVRYET